MPFTEKNVPTNYLVEYSWEQVQVDLVDGSKEDIERAIQEAHEKFNHATSSRETEYVILNGSATADSAAEAIDIVKDAIYDGSNSDPSSHMIVHDIVTEDDEVRVYRIDQEEDILIYDLYHYFSAEPDLNDWEQMLMENEENNEYDPAQDKINAIFVQPGLPPELIQIPRTVKALQSAVGGHIEPSFPYDGEVSIICNAAAKIEGMPFNRSIYKEPQKIELSSYQELKEKFREFEQSSNGKQHLTGYVVFSQDSFLQPYSEESRTYEISSNNKAYTAGKNGYSIFGNCLDGRDEGVRLDYYMAEEHGGADGWKVEKCYLQNDHRKRLDIIAGDFIVVATAPDPEAFKSLSDDLMNKYMEEFKSPELFFSAGDEIISVPQENLDSSIDKNPDGTFTLKESEAQVTPVDNFPSFANARPKFFAPSETNQSPNTDNDMDR